MSILRSLQILLAGHAVLGGVTTGTAMANPRNSMHEYRFNIEEYELSFSVPKAFLSGMWNRPDRYNPEWKKDRRGEGSYAEYFFHTHWFKGPVWVGNYASAIFIIRIIEADSEYSGQISTLDDLDKYLNWEWMFDGSKTYHPKISRKTISGFDWIQTTIEPSNSKKNVNRGPENTILWFPLGNRRYLMVLWQIDEFVPGKTNRWLDKAHEMRDQILNSIVMRQVN
ncbi:MAG: hypothetical protein H3C27_11375 [Opitutaceae bacterium]|nr:hypothetical protein [Opitutaceae bacterium]